MTPNEKVTVVIGFAESLSAPEVLWSLVDHGYKVVAFTRKGAEAALRYSRHTSLFSVAAPETEAERCASDIGGLLRKIREKGLEPLLLPLDDAALWICGPGRLAHTHQLVSPALNNIQLALDKAMQVNYAERAGFAVPATEVVADPLALSRTKIKAPLVIKPVLAIRESAGTLLKGRSWTCGTERELSVSTQTWDGSERMLVQEFVLGRGEGIFGLSTDQGVVGWSSHRRLRMMNPAGSGSSACMSLPVDEEAKRCAEQFILLSRWKGLFMIELLRDRAGKLWFMELNGRPWGSMALARRVGLEYPAWSVQSLLRPKDGVSPVAFSAGEKPLADKVVCRHLGREIMYLVNAIRGPRSAAFKDWPTRTGALRELLRIKRSEHWYNWRSDDWKVFVADLVLILKHHLVKRRSG